MTDIEKLRALALADDVEMYLFELDLNGVADADQLRPMLKSLRNHQAKTKPNQPPADASNRNC